MSGASRFAYRVVTPRAERRLTGMSTTARLFAMCVALVASSTACGGPAEFVAAPANFQGYRSWTQTTASLMGPGPMASVLGMAHGATDPSSSRSIYINAAGQAARAGTAAFPLGTVLVKEQRAADGTVQMVLGMAKRGNGFNPGAAGWEWFILDESGAVMTRGGAEVMMGMCNNCHSGAASRDLVFTR